MYLWNHRLRHSKLGRLVSVSLLQEMAIIANRIKTKIFLLEAIRLIFLFLKRLTIAFLIILSIYLLSVWTPPVFSNLIFEATGAVFSFTAALYNKSISAISNITSSCSWPSIKNFTYLAPKNSTWIFKGNFSLFRFCLCLELRH